MRRPFLLIREFKPTDDEFVRRDLIKRYVLSFAFEAFMSCLFREIFIQLTVLVAALMFIFMGLPIHICLASVPIVMIALYVSVYSAYLSKAFELSYQPVKNCWVAETYEPPLYGLTKERSGLYDFDLVHEENLKRDDPEVLTMRKSVIGVISVEVHRSLPNAGWISHLAVDPKYKFEKIAEPLINRALRFGIEIQMYSMETATTECQVDLRELLLKMGFALKQVYNRQIMGSSSFRIMKSQMGIDLVQSAVSKNK